MERSKLKGPAFPADFSSDIPEYSDEELAAAMEKARQKLGQQRQKAQQASASSPPPSSTTSPQK